MTQRDVERGALRAFAEHLARGRGSIDDLCRGHPELERSLRELEARRRRVTLPPPRVACGAIGERDHASARAGRYVLLGEIAHGGMGVILHVWDTVLERELAMKVLDVDASSNGDDAKSRFLTEAQVAAQLEHPGVVPVYDVGLEQGGRLYFTMPRIAGRNLEEVFDLARARSEGWSLTRALLAIGKLCDVVAFAHSRGVIHRDLKPANVMVGAFGEIYVVDWGLAKTVGERERRREEPEVTDGTAPGETLDGTIAGTPPYLAPEQAQGRVAEVAFRADVYAIGAILYRLLAGRAPYAPRQGREDPAATLALIRRGPPTPLRRLAPTAPRELVAICETAMAWKPDDRYTGVRELARDLDGFLEGRVMGMRRGGFWSEVKEKLLRRGRPPHAAESIEREA